MLVFHEGRDRSIRRRTLRANNKLNPHLARGRNRTHATLVGDKRSHHCVDPAPKQTATAQKFDSDSRNSCWNVHETQLFGLVELNKKLSLSVLHRLYQLQAFCAHGLMPQPNCWGKLFCAHGLMPQPNCWVLCGNKMEHILIEMKFAAKMLNNQSELVSSSHTS